MACELLEGAKLVRRDADRLEVEQRKPGSRCLAGESRQLPVLLGGLVDPSERRQRSRSQESRTGVPRRKANDLLGRRQGGRGIGISVVEDAEIEPGVGVPLRRNLECRYRGCDLPLIGQAGRKLSPGESIAGIDRERDPQAAFGELVAAASTQDGAGDPQSRRVIR